ncbi:MAG: hypothetical protein KBT45_04140 [Bacteroidales bacterium]|nr:hypothetical protein [Candidatus Colimorpha pelethequi]
MLLRQVANPWGWVEPESKLSSPSTPRVRHRKRWQEHHPARKRLTEKMPA